MKIKFLIFFLLLTFCSKSEITSESIEIQDFQIQELTYLESNKNALLDSEFLIINYWPSWCLECIEEHDLLISLNEIKSFEGKVVLISFQDNTSNSKEFLSKPSTKLPIYSKQAAVNSLHCLRAKLARPCSIASVNFAKPLISCAITQNTQMTMNPSAPLHASLLGTSRWPFSQARSAPHWRQATQFWQNQRSIPRSSRILRLPCSMKQAFLAQRCN